MQDVSKKMDRENNRQKIEAGSKTPFWNFLDEQVHLKKVILTTEYKENHQLAEMSVLMPLDKLNSFFLPFEMGNWQPAVSIISIL